MAKIFAFETGSPRREELSPRIRLRIILFRMLLLGIAAALIVMERGFAEHPFAAALAQILQLANLEVSIVSLNRLVQLGWFLAYAGDFWSSAYRRRLPVAGQPPDYLDLGLTVAAVLGILGHVSGTLPWGWGAFQGALIIQLMMELWRFNVALSRKLLRPGLMLPLSFITLIAVATPVLKVPLAIQPGRELSWLDALFTITSAACVTGLIVQDTATHFTAFGQAVIAFTIQMGGLGIVIFGTLVAQLIGDRMSISENLSLSSALNGQPLSRLHGLVRLIVASTLLIELVGAAAMMPLWHTHPVSGLPLTFEHRVGLSAFHSISAFCNAGFGLYTDSLVQYRYSSLTHLVIIPLIVLGGLGFPVLDNLWRMLIWRIKRLLWPKAMRQYRDDHHLADSRLSLHTKVVLATSAGLYIYGVVLLGAGQLVPHSYAWLGLSQTANAQPLPPLGPQRVGQVLADASFQSVTARTAGFNSMPMEEISKGGRFVLMTLMMVGGSPGGTSGGMRTTTLAILLLSVMATLRAREQVEAFGRRIGDVVLRQAATLAGCYLTLVGVATFLLCLSEAEPFQVLFFEAISAATTTGLSIRSVELTSFGKVVIIVTMYLGRIGPLALLGAIVFATVPPRPYQYPREDVLIG
ncbi:MAG: potassium transporter TrkG [Phycisphaeraceae bacterium]